MYMAKSNAPSTLPCGMPDVLLAGGECSIPSATYCVQLATKRMEPAKCNAVDFEIGTETFVEDVVVNGVECGRNVQ